MYLKLQKIKVYLCRNLQNYHLIFLTNIKNKIVPTDSKCSSLIIVTIRFLYFEL